MKRTLLPWAMALLATPAFAQTGPGTTMHPSGSMREHMEQHAGKMLPDKGPQSMIDALQRRTREYEQAWNAHDVSKLVSFYSQDATFVSPTSVANGRMEIEQMLRKEHQGALKNSTATFTIQSIQALSPTSAVADVRQSFYGATPQPGQPPLTDLQVTVIGHRAGNDWWVDAVRAFPVTPAPTGVGGAGGSMTPTEPGTGDTENLPRGNPPRKTDVPEKH